MRLEGFGGLDGDVGVVDCVAVGIDDDVGIPRVVNGDDCEALAGDGGGEDVVVEARDAVAGGEEKDGAVAAI